MIKTILAVIGIALLAVGIYCFGEVAFWLLVTAVLSYYMGDTVACTKSYFEGYKKGIQHMREGRFTEEGKDDNK